MTAQFCWLLALSLVVCLHAVGGDSQGSEGPPPHDDVPQTIDEAMMKASGGKRTRNFSVNSRFIEDGMDMVLTPRQHERLYSGARLRSGDHTVVATPWTDGVIPYQITPNDFNREQQQWILRAMRHWEQVTCVRFRPATSHDKNNVTIRTGKGCWANLGMVGGNQIVNLDPYCFWKGTIEHELGHTIGLIHEHQRPQRDAYIRVNYFGVQYNFVNALEKYAKGSDDKMGLEYDYTSVMHYGKNAFAADGYSQTLFTRDPTKEYVIGMIMGPSFLDAKLVNLMYECRAKCGRSVQPTCQGDCFLTAGCTCFCKNDMPKEVCQDHGEKCQQWKDQGECRGNSFYMHTFCRKSCGICKEDGSTPILPCINSQESCENWARSGQCQTNAGYMRKRCRLACGLCDPNDDLTPKGPCRDKNSTCRALAENGGCVRDPGHMLKDCTKSCDFCPEHVGDDPSEHPEACSDFDGVCYYWADNNLCNKYYAWMSQNCKNACGLCNANIVLPADCVDNYKGCREWAFNGECTNNPRYMLRHCNQSCDHCEGLVKPEVGCVDFNLDCPKWAASYECWASPKWMETNCPKSCKLCPGDPPRQEAPCMDFSSNCVQWSARGECQRNPVWMTNHCKKSCRKCTGREPTLPPTTTVSTTAGPCVDDHKDCQIWANDRQCQKNPGYMNNHCRKSCRLCTGDGSIDTTPGPCVDDHKDCASWASNGQCQENPGYMNNHCRKSCRLCTGDGSIDTTPGSCVDENVLCPTWAMTNQCQSNPGYMTHYCKKSCKICSGGDSTDTPSGTCQDETSTCKAWADYGECERNPSYMRHHCKKSCRVCSG